MPTEVKYKPNGITDQVLPCLEVEVISNRTPVALWFIPTPLGSTTPVTNTATTNQQVNTVIALPLRLIKSNCKSGSKRATVY